MNLTKDDIDLYLTEVKEAISHHRYSIALNKNRQDNRALFFDYVIDEAMARDILLDLSAMDFSEVVQNAHKGYEHELLYVFGKDVVLLERMGHASKKVSLYIKFNKMENCYVVVISMHEQKYPMKYYFK